MAAQDKIGSPLLGAMTVDEAEVQERLADLDQQLDLILKMLSKKPLKGFGWSNAPGQGEVIWHEAPAEVEKE
jgi:hypothetical protein